MKKVLFLIPVLLFNTIASYAYIDSNHMTSDQYLINAGYSKTTAETVNEQKRSPYGPMTEKTDKRSFLMKLYNYIDPVSGADHTYPRHDVNPNSNWQDL